MHECNSDITIYIYYYINTHIFHLFYFQSRISQASSCEVPGIAPLRATGHGGEAWASARPNGSRSKAMTS